MVKKKKNVFTKEIEKKENLKNGTTMIKKKKNVFIKKIKKKGYLKVGIQMGING